MKEFFNENGHLTDYAFNSIIKYENDELNRLEIAEHMSFCDECLLKYTNLLDDSELISPPESLGKGIMSKIRFKTAKTFIRPYISLAIAASFTIILWTSGVFTMPELSKYNMINATKEITENFSNSINKIFDNIELKGDIQYEKK